MLLRHLALDGLPVPEPRLLNGPSPACVIHVLMHLPPGGSGNVAIADHPLHVGARAVVSEQLIGGGVAYAGLQVYQGVGVLAVRLQGDREGNGSYPAVVRGGGGRGGGGRGERRE